MTSANGLRLLMAGRKSRKGDEDTQFDRQEARNKDRAERDGHVVVHKTRDVVSSQTMPWDRRELKAWMSDPAKIDLYDGLLVETDRLSRCDDRGWHFIEDWCYRHDKVIITTEGVQFPPRDDSDRYQWVGLKRRARTYWEDVRDKHAQTREIIRANGGAIGKPPFGYVTSGEKLKKTFVIDPVAGPLAKAAFQRIADGRTATSVAVWLTEQTGKPWRIKRVTDMIRRRTYLGERDGVTFEPLISEGLFNAANSALNARSFEHSDKGGHRVEHGYSSLIKCQCGATMYRHFTGRGNAKYRCSTGRSGDVTQQRCDHGAPVYEGVNTAIDAVMSRCTVPERIMVTTGGDHARQTQLADLQKAMSAAMTAGDMPKVTELAAAFSEAQSRPAEPIKTTLRETGRTYADVWAGASLSDRRDLLGRGDFTITVAEKPDGWAVYLDWQQILSPAMVEMVTTSGLDHLPAYRDEFRLSA